MAVNTELEEELDKSKPLVSVGVVGGGFIGRTVGSQFGELDTAEVKAVVDIDSKTLRTAGEELGVPEEARYEDYEAMLKSEDLDAVLLGTPHTLHYEQVLTAMEHDLHVLCDKPLTTDLDHARDLVERDTARDEVLMVGYQRHLYQSFVKTRDTLEKEGRIPQWITAEVSQNWVDRFSDAWRTNPDLSGGGYLYDTGSHILDSILWSTGLTPTAVSAEMDFVDNEQRVDGRSHVTIRFEEGTTATVVCSGETPCMREHIHMWDEEGAIYLESQDWEPNKLTEIDSTSGEYSPRLDRGDLPNKAEAFVQSIRDRESPPATALDGLRVTAVTEAAYESARQNGEFVTIDPTDVALD
ncbi:Gfo/Idh/MocA family protein [Haladaptatus sp. NG-WS-4]